MAHQSPEHSEILDIDLRKSDTSRLFDKPESARIAVKVINHLGDEVMKVFRVG